jgi:hypothetical protein
MYRYRLHGGLGDEIRCPAAQTVTVREYRNFGHASILVWLVYWNGFKKILGIWIILTS